MMFKTVQGAKLDKDDKDGVRRKGLPAFHASNIPCFQGNWAETVSTRVHHEAGYLK